MLKRTLIGLIAVAALGLVAAGLSTAADEKAAEPVDVIAKAESGGWTFIGADGCKMCHKTEKSGDQYGKWLESKHAKAFATLASEEAKAVATKAGVQGNPQEAAECLSCHVTAHGAKAELLGEKFAKEEGVSCESCHGAGSGYKPKKIMEDQAASIANGLVLPTEALCKTCHNEKSPTFKGFNYEEMVAKIAHPTPKGE